MSNSNSKKGKGKGKVSNVNQYETLNESPSNLSSITELEEVENTPLQEPEPEPEPESAQVQLNTKEGCVSHLLSMLEKCSHTLSLKECVVVNRAVKFLLKKEPIISFSSDSTLTEQTAIETVCQGVSLGHTKKAFTLDESTIIYYCIDFVTKV